MRIEIQGQKPDLYCDEKYGNFNRKIWVKTYELVTADSFEFGEAYSMHLTEKNAYNYLTDYWWRHTSGPFQVFVTKKTLEKLMQKKDKTIFRCWEN